jgi:hypothetical protein
VNSVSSQRFLFIDCEDDHEEVDPEAKACIISAIWEISIVFSVRIIPVFSIVIIESREKHEVRRIGRERKPLKRKNLFIRKD